MGLSRNSISAHSFTTWIYVKWVSWNRSTNHRNDTIHPFEDERQSAIRGLGLIPYKNEKPRPLDILLLAAPLGTFYSGDIYIYPPLVRNIQHCRHLCCWIFYLSICLSVSLSVCLYTCLSVVHLNCIAGNSMINRLSFCLPACL